MRGYYDVMIIWYLDIFLLSRYLYVMLSRGTTPEKEIAMPKTKDIHQTTLRADATTLRKARFYLNEEGSSINEFCAKQLEQYIEKRERRAPSPLVEHREPQAS